MRAGVRWGAVLWAALGAVGVGAQDRLAVADPPALTEADYFDPVPVVLTVTRLVQSLADTPGAVTVLDRDDIRRSGARDVTDLLRLVPGYLASGWNGANPSAVYHTPLDDLGTRNLVLVDGRSVYSPFYLGDTHRGLMGVLLEDIDRIEVLRGANSAAYGANALFGVVNIITRHAADTPGPAVGLTVGSPRVQDVYARLGWGDAQASTRVSVGERRDSGYSYYNDDRAVRQWHWRTDLKPSGRDDVQLQAGGVALDGHEGLPGSVNNPERPTQWNSWYLQGRWRQQWSDTEQLQLSVSLDDERIQDRAPYQPLPGVTLDFGGHGRRFNLELQHQRALGPDARAVWGLGFKQDEAWSRAIYAQDAPVRTRETRAFGNLEWRLAPRWLLNAGLFVGDHSWTGTYTAPRVMLNLQLAPDHVLRAGVTRSFRAPSQFELAGDVRYHLNGTLVGRTWAVRGQAEPEVLRSEEVSYFGQVRDWRLTVDARAYRERLRGLIETTTYRLPERLPATGNKAFDFVNSGGLSAQGLEYQLRWSPREQTEFWWQQNLMSYRGPHLSTRDRQPPARSATLTWFERLPQQWSLALMWHHIGAMNWREGREDLLPATRRLDLRVARAFRWQGQPAEAALTVQALDGDWPIFVGDSPALFQRRAYATLRVGF